MSDVSTVDHKSRHIWVRTPSGTLCAYMGYNAKPEPTDVAKLEAEEAQRATRVEIRWTR